MSGPRMGMSQMNGSNRRPLSRAPSNDKPANGQHNDLIQYIYDSWNKVSQEADKNSGSSVLFYQEQEHNLKDFEPFDLEGFWGRRMVQNLQQGHHS